MSYDEIKRRVSAWLVQTNYTTAETLAIEQAYRDVFGRGVRDCKCPNRYRDAVIELRIFIKNHATMEKSNYKLKTGVVIQPSGTSEVYTNDNLTDEIAEQFLKERPGARGLFAVAPTTAESDKTPTNDGKQAKNGETDAIVAALEQENESLKAGLAKMTAERDEQAAEVARLNAVIAANTPEAEDDAKQDEAEQGNNDTPEAEKPSGLNPEILSAIKARLAGGETKSAIIKDYVGMTVDGKALSEYAVKKYITAASAE